MRPARLALALVTMCGFMPEPASGQTTMTLSEILARAREHAPEIVSARLAVEEARGRLAGASVRRAANPEIETEIGNRNGATARFTDVGVGLSQALEPGSRRAARLAGATANIDRTTATVEETTRHVLREAAAAFYRALHANERIRLLTSTEELASRVRQSAERRFQAGDIAVLDVNIARAALARVRSERQAAAATAAAALGDLRTLLRMDGDLQVQGNLTTVEAVPGNLLETALRRPELGEIEAAIREADADVQLGRSFQKPEFGLGARYARDEGDHVVSGGLKMTFPVFSRGQELRATGSARATRLRSDLELARARIRTEIETAGQTYALRRDAIHILETEALPGLDENDALAARSFEVGQIGLTDFLLIRREILDTRFQYLDALLEAALARVGLLSSAGVLR